MKPLNKAEDHMGSDRLNPQTSTPPGKHNTNNDMSTKAPESDKFGLNGALVLLHLFLHRNEVILSLNYVQTTYTEINLYKYLIYSYLIFITRTR